MDKVINEKDFEIRENVVAGIAGAFLFSLAGAVVYFLLHLVGYIASISGLIGVVCAIKGYAIFAKKESKKGIIIASIISILVIVMAWYFCLAYDVYDVYKTGFELGETDFSLTFFESVRVAPVFLEEPEILRAYLSDLALGLLFCLIGGGSYVFNKLKNANKKNVVEPQAEVVQPVVEQAEEKAEEKAEEAPEEASEEANVEQ